MDHASLRRADLTEAETHGAASAQFADFEGATLDKAKFSGVLVANGANFNKANLHSAILDRAILTDATFVEAGLGEAGLVEISAARANFAHAALAKADFSGAFLVNATFGGADVSEAKFAHSNLMGASFVGARGIASADFNDAVCPPPLDGKPDRLWTRVGSALVPCRQPR